MDGDRPPSAAPEEAAPAPKAHDADEIEDGPAPGLLSRVFGIFAKPENSNGELAEAIDGGDSSAMRSLPRARREMIERVIAFDEKRVDDVMAPRADIVAVDIDTTLDEVVKIFAEAGHSRLPLYRNDLDNPQGMVHIKDVVELLAAPEKAAAGEGPVLQRIRRQVLYVPPSMRITDLLLRMQASRIHMALVIDEYGGTDGLLTIEDLVEEIVGDINDEHDDEDQPIIAPRPGGGWDADARVELADFTEATGLTLEVYDEEEVDTVGGLVVSLAGRVPQRGEVLSHPAGYDFEVTEADARKIRKIRIRPRPATDARS